MFLRSGRVKVYDFNPHPRKRSSRRRSRPRITNTHRYAEEPHSVSITGSCDVHLNGLCLNLEQSNFQSLRLRTSNHIGNVIQCLHKCANTFLKNVCGQYVKLGGGGDKLVATSSEEGVNLEITKIAFCFKDREDGHYIVSVDENDKVQLIKIGKANVQVRQVIERNQPTSIWFQMCHSGDHGYCIKMAERTKCWAIDKTSQSVTLKDSAGTLESLFTTSIWFTVHLRYAEEPHSVSITGSCDVHLNGLCLNLEQSNFQSLRLTTSNHIGNVIQRLHKCANTFLKNVCGQYVKLGGGGDKLVATSSEEGVNLEIWKRDNKIAFCFKDREDGHYIVSVDENDKVQLIKIGKANVQVRQVIERNQTSIWFQMCHSGDHGYCIKMAERTKYWAIDKTSRSVTLKDSAGTLESLFTTSTCKCLEKGCPGVVADVPDAR